MEAFVTSAIVGGAGPGTGAITAIVISFIAAGIVGILGLYVWMRKKIQSHTLLEQEYNHLQATTQAQAEAREMVYQERIKAFETAEQRMTQVFQNLSNRSLQDATQSFFSMAKNTFDQLHNLSKQDLQNRQGAINEMLAPFKERLVAMDSKLNELEKTRVTAYTSLHHQVKDMLTAQERLHQETSTLAKALRLPSVKGRWGEVQLRRLVELAGMMNHCDFLEQPTAQDPSGQKYRPDMIIRLPGDKEIILDSKVPIKAYLEAMEATSDAEKQQALKSYVKHVRFHVKELASKNYWQHFSKAPEFVILFLPADPFLSTAIEQDPLLMEDAFSQHVVLATPATLMTILQSMAYGWQQATMADKIHEVRSLGSTLYQKIASLADEMDKLGRQLRLSVGSYNKSLDIMMDQITPLTKKLGDDLGKDTSKLTKPNTLHLAPGVVNAVQDLTPSNDGLDTSEGDAVPPVTKLTTTP